MLGAWFGYLVFLAAVLLFYILFSGWFAGYMLALSLLLPILSLLLSLPGIRGLRVGLHMGDSGRRGQAVPLVVRVENRFCLPVRCLAMRVQCANQMTGHSQHYPLRLPLGCEGEAVSRPFLLEHCGVVRCRLQFVRAYDFMGLFPILLKGQRAVYLLAEPQPEGGDVPAGLGSQLSEEPMRREQGSTLDDYAVRPYRPGDSLRVVHWKLSSKLDELVVREPEGDHRPDVVLLFDLYGQPEGVDALLDRLASCSLQLRERGRAHRLVWADGSGRLCHSRVESDADFAQFLWQTGVQRPPVDPTDVRQIWPGSIEGGGQAFYIEGPERRKQHAQPQETGSDAKKL